MSLTFLTPVAGVVGTAALLPLAAAAVGSRRARRVRRALRLQSPAPDRLGPFLLLLVPLVLGVAAMQPALAHGSSRHVRSDAAVFVVVDTSRSMLASVGPGAPTRLVQARAVAQRIRGDLPDVPVGLASFSDRVVPMLFPVADEAAFDSTVQEALRYDSPPPVELAPNATSFDALAALGTQGFFAKSTRHRVVVLLTDGESQPFDAATVGAGLDGVSLVVVRLGSGRDRVYVDGKAEAAYRPDPNAASLVARLVATARGTALGAGQAGAAATAVRHDLGTGPTTAVAGGLERTPLGPWVALATLVPLGVVLRRRLLVAF